MTKSDSIAKLAEALAKVQGALHAAVKGTTNPFFKKKYADLTGCWDVCRKLLADNGIAVVQTTDDTGNCKILVETTLLHTSGEWISGKLAIKPVQDTPQAIGSALTYGRRYGLCAAVGIVTEDDDGNEASGRSNGGSHDESESPTTKAAKAPTSKANTSFDNGKWKELVVHFGKDKGPIRGKKLGVLKTVTLAWLRDTWRAEKDEERKTKGILDGKDQELYDALTAYAKERAAIKENEAQKQPDADKHEDQDIPWNDPKESMEEKIGGYPDKF